MAWKVEVDEDARKHLKKLNPQIAKRIVTFLFDRLAKLENPHSIGEALHGPKLGEFWKYRVGDYRFISRIEDDIITVVVVAIGNRSEVYR
jgi:mRNA interferase RelE/StbE